MRSSFSEENHDSDFSESLSRISESTDPDLSSFEDSEDDAVEETGELSSIDEPDPRYSDTMNLDTLNADVESLNSFVESVDYNETVSYVELHRVFEIGVKFNDFMERAKAGTAKLVAADDLSSMRKTAVETFNQAEPAMKVDLLKEIMGESLVRPALLLKIKYPSEVGRIKNFRNFIAQHLQKVAAIIAEKNDKGYQEVSVLPAYSPVIKQRRAEVEAMLDQSAMANENRPTC